MSNTICMNMYDKKFKIFLFFLQKIISTIIVPRKNSNSATIVMSIKKVDLSVKNQEFTLENNDYKLETPFKLLIQGNPKVNEFMK